MAKALDIIRESSPKFGVKLNIHRIEIFWPLCDDSKLVKLFPSDIGGRILGMKLLGRSVSRDEGFIEDLSMKRAVWVIELMHLLPQLRILKMFCCV